MCCHTSRAMNKHIGSSFDDFLAEGTALEETTAVAIKRVVAWQIAQEMKAQHLTKTALAEKMHTSRAALNRLLDGDRYQPDADDTDQCRQSSGQESAH